MPDRKPRVLIVEDDFLIAMDLERSLTSLGYQVVAKAATADKALAGVARANPDVVLMDITLEGNIDGVEAANMIRQEFDVPIIFVTAHSDRPTLERAKVTEPLGYITKPFEEKDLRISIELALFKHQQEKLLRDSRHWLSTALKSIGECVIAVDTRGNIVFINPAAQLTTGWSEQKVLGKAFKDVFMFYDGKTGELMDCPMEKALAQKETLFLKDDVQLAKADGGRLSIIDSVAPLLDESAETLGGILVFQDITGRDRADASCQRTLVELRRSNKALMDFAATASHDLKEPLRKVVSFGNLLKGRMQGDEVARDYVDRMSSASQRMSNLIDDLLNFCRIATRRKQVETVDLKEVVRGVLSDLETRIETTRGRVDVGPLPAIEGEKFQMRQLFQNLIGNALKYHRKDTPPVVTVSSSGNGGDTCRIVVEDNGIGFDEKYARRIFEPFERLVGVSEFEGVGLGLATCKKIVEHHGGEITVRSAPGRGSAFIVTLPKKQNPDATAKA